MSLLRINLNELQRAMFLTGARTYQANCGRRRVFLSASDAAAYDAGYAAYPCGPIPEVGTPAGMGFFDAEDRALDNLDN